MRTVASFEAANAVLAGWATTAGTGEKVDYRIEYGEDGGLYSGWHDLMGPWATDLVSEVRAWCKWWAGEPDCPWCLLE